MDKTVWLRELLREHEGRLLRYARRMLPDEHAREVVQESFLRLWRETSEDLKGRETEWLFCVCRNLAIDVLKKEGNMGSHPMDASELVSAEETADQRLERRQTESDMLRLIGALPGTQREVICLKFQEGFSYKEISSITGLSVSHVGVLIHEAIARLRREMVTQGATSQRQGGRQ